MVRPSHLDDRRKHAQRPSPSSRDALPGRALPGPVRHASDPFQRLRETGAWVVHHPLRRVRTMAQCDELVHDGGEALSRRGERLNRQVCRQKRESSKRIERTAGQSFAGEPQPQTERQRSQCRDCKGLAVRAGRGGRGRCRVRPMNAPEELRQRERLRTRSKLRKLRRIRRNGGCRQRPRSHSVHEHATQKRPGRQAHEARLPWAQPVRQAARVRAEWNESQTPSPADKWDK